MIDHVLKFKCINKFKWKRVFFEAWENMKNANFVSYIIRNENIEINSNEREYEKCWRKDWLKNEKLVLKSYATVENVWRNLITASK